MLGECTERAQNMHWAYEICMYLTSIGVGTDNNVHRVYIGCTQDVQRACKGHVLGVLGACKGRAPCTRQAWSVSWVCTSRAVGIRLVVYCEYFVINIGRQGVCMRHKWDVHMACMGR